MTTNGTYRLSAVIYDVDKPSHDVDLSSPCSLSVRISTNGNIYEQTIKKKCKDPFPLKKTAYYYKNE